MPLNSFWYWIIFHNNGIRNKLPYLMHASFLHLNYIISFETYSDSFKQNKLLKYALYIKFFSFVKEMFGLFWIVCLLEVKCNKKSRSIIISENFINKHHQSQNLVTIVCFSLLRTREQFLTHLPKQASRWIQPLYVF